jgi:glycine/D-amino acid oxidase-like deaminating enzyme
MTEIVIIGAGVIGAAIAYELSLLPNLNITLLEKNQAASGTSGAALGVLMGVISKKTKGRAWTLRQATLARFESLLQELQELTGQTLEINDQGIVLLLFSEEEHNQWHKRQILRQAEGYRLELWDREMLAHKCPQIRGENILSAVYSPQDRQIQPRQFTEALVTAACLKGVDYRSGVTVQDFTVHPAHRASHGQVVQSVQTDQGDFVADQVIITAGLESLALTQQLHQTVKLEPVLGQALRIQLPQILGHPHFQPVITGEDVHIVPLGKGEYWLGATVEFLETSESLQPDPLSLEKLLETAIAFCPDLAKARILHSWSGQRPQPKEESSPILRPLAGYDNVLIATGHYRNGILLAPASALWVRDYLLAQDGL